VDAARRMASDHEVVEDLLTRLSGSSTSDGRGELADEFARRLRAHVRAADELLVPVLRQRATGGDLARLDEVDAVDTRLTGELERLARTVGIIVAAGVLLAVWGRLRPRMRTSGPLPPRR
jgi:hypothetical protein